MQRSASHYSHTQVGWWLIVALGVAVLALAAGLAGIRAGSRPPATPELAIIFTTVIVVLAITAVLLTTLTVHVTVDVVSWHFGPGVIHFSLPIAEITNVAVARTPLWAGIGIHWIFTGWVYNVSGRDAVQLTKRDGSKVWIGSNEPHALAAAIEGARAGTPPDGDARSAMRAR
jgi:amino acid transporter